MVKYCGSKELEELFSIFELFVPKSQDKNATAIVNMQASVLIDVFTKASF